MLDRRFAVMGSAIYGVAIAATLIAGATTAFIVVLIVGGAITSMLYWGSRGSRASVPRNRNRVRRRG